MPVSRHEIISRGLRLRCPNCGAKSLFAARTMRINRECPECGLVLDRGEGFFLGPMVVNYGIVAFVFVVPLVVLWAQGVLPGTWAAGIAITSCLILPIVLYRSSWSLWLMFYFWFLTERLPANRATKHDPLQE